LATISLAKPLMLVAVRMLSGVTCQRTLTSSSGLVTAAPIPAERKEAKRPRAKRKEGS